MDEAFQPLSAMLQEMASFRGEFVDGEAGVRTYIRRFEIEAPIELDVEQDAGSVQIGSTPPLYNVKTSILPSFHHIRLIAEIEEERDGD